VLGDVPAEGLARAVGVLADDVVVRVLVEATVAITSLDAVRAVAAGVIAARSGRDAGHGGLAQTRGHRSPVTLVQEITGTTKGDAVRQVRLGEALLEGEPAVGGEPGAADPMPVAEPWHAPLGAAVLAGTITTTQQDVIRRNLGDPPNDNPDVIDAWRAAAEQLITEAAERTVEELGRAARVIRDVLDPEGAERRFQGRYEARSFRTWTDADGIAHGSFTFDDHGHAWNRAVIDAALRPRTGGPRFVDPTDKAQADALVGDPRTNDQLTYDLILDLLHAGTLADAKTVFGAKQPGIRVVRIMPTTVTTDTGGYVEETGEPVPAAFLDQDLCDTGTTDCTLDTDGNPLYLGREARLFTPAQKTTLALRDGGCRIPACDRAAHYCEAHHIDEYAKGGRTDVDRGILLCTFHHTTLHHHGWHITRTGLGNFLLHRPGEPPVVLKPRLALTYTWAGIDPPPTRFRPAA